MKIAILLPYKENFSPEYPGAVSLFVNETSKISKYKKEIIVFGNTNYKKKYNLKYININLIKNPLSSQTREYINKFSKIQKNIIYPYLKFTIDQVISFSLIKLFQKGFSLYFHNDPLSMDGSKTIEERKKLLKICYKIIFNWSKKRFLEGLENKFVNSNKLVVFSNLLRKILFRY